VADVSGDAEWVTAPSLPCCVLLFEASNGSVDAAADASGGGVEAVADASPGAAAQLSPRSPDRMSTHEKLVCCSPLL
jgi:hypothetical protein